MELSKREFAAIVERALEGIPPEIGRHIENVAITIEDRASPDLLREMGLPPDEPLFGVYTGVAVQERSVSSPPLYPDTIILFREPLLEFCESMEELEYEIETTVVHEVAHYFGISEERLEELGYD
jgi:predicted Zn-dependent protease with MMP-like domain